MKIISVRENHSYKEIAIKFFQSKWASPETEIIYEDCIKNSLQSLSPLPQWYLLENDDGEIIGGSGIITNDFISRMDLYPWFCALYIEESFRGNNYSKLLIDRSKIDAKKNNFDHLYLCTEFIGFYEKYGFKFIGHGYHPGGTSSRIYEIET